MGTSVQLRLPVVKRSTSAPIAMQGWLHKQGSEGLMLWKKRWFVLAEYCLFYYKNSEEDRLLGSILLPSYKISPCSAIEGKIFRKKYSFKAEHANMRTYYFAADSREQMVQWMNAMSLATIAQQFNGFLQLSTLKRDKVNFHFGNNNTNCTTDVDATRNGLTGSMMLPCKARNSGSCSSGGGTTENSSSQPLYVNAPPKPRRVTDPSESSTDNDFSNANSPATNDLTFRDDREYQPPYVKKVLANVTQSQLNGMNESRTLNVYSRSPSVDPQPLTYSRCKVYKQSNADYEELYNLTIMNHNNSSNGSGSTNATQKCPSRMSFHANSSTIERSTKTPFGYRPRSVDFLEVPRKRNEGKTNSEYSMGEIRAQTNSRNYSQRVLASTPKSSIITDNSDSFYWSEERYAQNMRKSAQYLVAKKLSSPSDVMKELNEFNKLPLRSTMYVRSAGVANLTPKTNTLLEGCTVEVASGSDGRTHGAVDVRINSADKTNTGSVQPKQYSQQRSNYLVNAYKTDETLNRSDFIRSKSARIQREKDRDIADHTGVESTNRRRNSLHSSESADRTNPQQTQQREESMKRLLEWKQKMLQSPLSRKSSGSSNRGVAQNDLFSNYKRSNGHSTYLLENAIGIKIPERDGGLTRNNQSWPLSDGNEDELSNDTQNLTSTNIDTSPQPNRNYREHQQEGRNSMNLLRKFDSESSDDEVYGSDSAIGHNTVLPPNTLQTSVNLEGVQQADPSVIDVASTASSTHYQQHHGRVNDVRSHSPHLSSDIHTEKLSDSAWNLDVSAGELLGRTHEELVLLLIQLRRQSASVCKAMENCHRDIENQATLAETETSKQGEYLNSVEDLKKRLNELEKQYEKGKPLVNLVDNMVKLGSLYRAGAASSTVQLVSGPLLEKLEFNHRVQEQRLLAEEQKEWERINPDHHQLQAKVEELYKLDRELQHESSTLQSLKQDKDLLENALGGLKHKIQGTQGNPTEIERYRRQQLLLERELSHVRSVLARNSNKLEETVTANSRLEAELVILRQKLQWSQRHSEDNLISAPAVAALENELKRVQMLVGDLQRQRNELSAQVRQLTEKSNNLSQQIRPSSTGIAGAGSVPVRKKANSGWTETDLDGDTTHDTSTDRSSNVMSPDVFQISAPLYANTKDRRRGDYFGNNGSELHYTKDAFCEDYHSNLSCLRPDSECGKPMDISESDDRTKRFYGILPREKSQEIKTVRIVKRESERRQRDRDRTGNVGIPVSLGVKRAAAYGNSMPDIDKNHLLSISEERERDVSLLYGCGYRKAGFSPTLPDYVEYRMGFESFPGAVASTENITSDKTHQDETPRTIDSQRGQDVPVNKLAKQSSDSPQLSPVYQSEAAKRIVQELVSTPIRRKDTNKRLVPKGKRRHHTVSSSKPLISAETYATHITRARDDVDMERALRPRLNAAPDVVRSTLSRTEPLRYNAETIDSVIGLPDKIFIPERYMPETEPELSPEEQNRRLKKADTIRKMLSETTTLASVENSERNEYNVKSLIHKKKFEEDRKQRDHILHLNQILAQQVTEKSKLVAGAILSNLS